MLHRHVQAVWWLCLEIQRISIYKRNAIMKKLLIKLFMPSASDITKMAVDAIARFINESGKEEVIAKYGTAADEFTKV